MNKFEAAKLSGLGTYRIVELAKKQEACGKPIPGAQKIVEGKKATWDFTSDSILWLKNDRPKRGKYLRDKGSIPKYCSNCGRKINLKTEKKE